VLWQQHDGFDIEEPDALKQARRFQATNGWKSTYSPGKEAVVAKCGVKLRATPLLRLSPLREAKAASTYQAIKVNPAAELKTVYPRHP
jgi:hypothetical protein